VTLTALAREATFDAVQTLRDCVNDAGEAMNTRCRAAGYLLLLGWGSAPKESTLRLVTQNTLAAMSEAELIAHAMARFEKSVEQQKLQHEGEVIDVQGE
jgi:hypothetical protein